MTAELLQERATALLELVREGGFRPTVPNLCTAAKKAFPELAKRGKEKELDELAGAACALNNGKDATSNADWPVRTVKRPPPPAPIAQTNEIPTTEGKMRTKTEAVLDALREVLPKHRDATNAQLFDLVAATGVEMCARTTFQAFHCSTVRKELGVEAKPGGAKRNGTSALAPKATSKAIVARKARAPEAVPATPPPTPAVPSASSSATIGTTIVLTGDDDSFVATRVEDGSWKVELAVTVDDETMGKLGTLVWQRVMGRVAA